MENQEVNSICARIAPDLQESESESNTHPGTNAYQYFSMKPSRWLFA